MSCFIEVFELEQAFRLREPIIVFAQKELNKQMVASPLLRQKLVRASKKDIPKTD